MMPRRLASRAPGFGEALAALTRYEAVEDEAVESSVRAIIRDVRARGDQAVLELTRRLDRLEAGSLADLEIPRAALEAALAGLPPVKVFRVK